MIKIKYDIPYTSLIKVLTTWENFLSIDANFEYLLQDKILTRCFSNPSTNSFSNPFNRCGNWALKNLSTEGMEIFAI